MAKLNKYELETLLPTETFFHGPVADVLTQGLPSQGIRSAIANALATSGGSNLSDSFSLRNPLISYLGSSGIGGLIGAGLGLGAGSLMNQGSNGALLGALLGTIIGGGANAIHRRKLIKKIKKELENKDLDFNKIPDRKAMALLNPVGAMYNADELATKALLKSKDDGSADAPVNEGTYNMMYGNVPAAQAINMAVKATPLGLLADPGYLIARIAGRRGKYRKALED